MNKTEFKLSWTHSTAPHDGLPVIVVGAGKSTRMGGTNKLFADLGGMPVIARTLLAFEQSPLIKNIILVVRDEDIFTLQLLTERYGISKLSDIVCGGASRPESVLKGFSRLKDGTKAVLIHDGARPLVDDAVITAVAEALKEHPAAVCGTTPKDTIHQIDGDGRIIKSLDRSSLLSVQTPQGVWVEEYLSACKKIDIATVTDDVSIMWAAGFEVVAVTGSYKNIKITTPEDLITALGYLKE